MAIGRYHFLINALTSTEKADIVINKSSGICSQHRCYCDFFNGTSTNINASKIIWMLLYAEIGVKLPGSWENIKECKKIKKGFFIEELPKLQVGEGLVAETKIKTCHIDWIRDNMKVALAAQKFSNIVGVGNFIFAARFKTCQIYWSTCYSYVL